MIADHSRPLTLKRRKLTSMDPLEVESAKAKMAAVREKTGREIRVFETSSLSEVPNQASNDEESDDFYEFTAEDYYRLLATKKEDKFLKTKKIREAEEAARRSRMTKAVIRVRFPDNHTLEATFHPSEKIQCLVDLIAKVIARPELPFYLYITPPKTPIKDLSQDFYDAGFVPGAIVYFSYDPAKVGSSAEAATSLPFLQEEVICLKGIEGVAEQAVDVHSAPEPQAVNPSPHPVPQESKPAAKKSVKPKWFKM